MDDTPIYANFLLKDIQRVEVLRGPQGTLYGSGALGGTVRYVMNQPELGEFSGTVGGALSSVEGSDGIGAAGDLTLNLPVGDTIAVRLNLAVADYPGLTDYVNLYVLDDEGLPIAPNGVLDPATEYRRKKDADDVEILYGRFAARWEPSDTFNATVSVFAQSDDVGGRRQQTPGADGFGNPYHDYENGSIQLEPSTRDALLGALEMNIDLGFATLTSSTSYYDHSGDSTSENTGFYAQAGLPVLLLQLPAADGLGRAHLERPLADRGAAARLRHGRQVRLRRRPLVPGPEPRLRGRTASCAATSAGSMPLIRSAPTSTSSSPATRTSTTASRMTSRRPRSTAS